MNKLFYPFAILLRFCILSNAQAPVLVKDINPGSPSAYSPIAPPVASNDYYYFLADDGVHGVELWRSDGTEAGTFMLKDIYDGSDQAGATKILGIYNNYLYFVGNANDTGNELWRTNGTGAGTELFFEGCPGSCGNNALEATSFIVYHDQFYFSSYVPGSSNFEVEMYKTDGTQAGTSIAIDLNGTFGGYPSRFFIFKDKLYFSGADIDMLNLELRATDGTQGGTYLVKDINPGSQSSIPEPLAATDDFLFLLAKTDSLGTELWRSDGTEGGTILVKDITPGPNSAFTVLPPGTKLFWNSKLYLNANDGANGKELWVSDGTDTGTHLLKDINSNSASGNPLFFGEFKGKLLFTATDGINGTEFWQTDGTETGTEMLFDLNPTGNGANIQARDVNNQLLFRGTTPTLSGVLHISDGTLPGTSIISDSPTEISGFQIIGNTLYFIGTSDSTGRELWKYDLTPLPVQEQHTYVKIKLLPTISRTGIFNVQFSDNIYSNIRFAVSNLAGKTFEENAFENTDQQLLDLSTLPSGLYFVSIFVDNQPRIVEKIIIIK